MPKSKAFKAGARGSKAADWVKIVPSRCPGLDPDRLQRGSSGRLSQAPSHTGADDGSRELEERLLLPLSWASALLRLSSLS